MWKTVEAEGECIVSRPRKVGPTLAKEITENNMLCLKMFRSSTVLHWSYVPWGRDTGEWEMKATKSPA